MVALVLMGAMPQPTLADVIYERETPYQLLRVSEADDGTRYLIFNEGSGVQSVYVPNGGRTHFYYDYMGIVPLLRPAESHRGLIIGLAGGTAAEKYGSFAPEIELNLTGVEVDAEVIAAARQHFELDRRDVTPVNADGRMFLLNEQQRRAEKYDAIVSDAYSTQLYIPPHLATREYFALVRERLTASGVLVMNVNAPSVDSRLLKALTNTVAAEFPHVTVVDVQNSWNHLVLASNQPLDLEEVATRVPDGFGDVAADLAAARTVKFDQAGEVFTDDRAPVEFLTDSMIVSQVLERAR
jgi:spermidine synthase